MCSKKVDTGTNDEIVIKRDRQIEATKYLARINLY